jgi:perosamine synthetase
MTDIQASLGIPQLNKLESFIETRARYALMYDDAFANWEGIRLQPRPQNPEYRHALNLYVLIISPECFSVSRNQIIDALLAENIGAALHYRALHTHPFYAKTYWYRAGDFPLAADVGENIFSLPLSPKMTMDDVTDVITAVHKVLRAYQR